MLGRQHTQRERADPTDPIRASDDLIVPADDEVGAIEEGVDLMLSNARGFASKVREGLKVGVEPCERRFSKTLRKNGCPDDADSD